ncbi:hypothetical protein LNKW23_21120 [Paralimibaculum aggregatum]|uniref:UPF0434 protein LNKW23_21120 n=2 Tax=Paralimibaculum aggregatum TaxID=3036245 RepID=A0ABQ6LKW2_9RHOB|nr:hypothetical protein LNKW23_21120 [Limibaculum sp. NKW23]
MTDGPEEGGERPAGLPVALPGGQSETAGGRMLELLVCPASGGRLIYDREAQELVSRSAGLAYPIRSGIPIMLIDEARQLEG